MTAHQAMSLYMITQISVLARKQLDNRKEVVGRGTEAEDLAELYMFIWIFPNYSCVMHEIGFTEIKYILNNAGVLCCTFWLF